MTLKITVQGDLQPGLEALCEDMGISPSEAVNLLVSEGLWLPRDQVLDPRSAGQRHADIMTRMAAAINLIERCTLEQQAVVQAMANDRLRGDHA